jgi:hypothetical protein
MSDGRHHAFPHVIRLTGPDGPQLLATWRLSSGHMAPDGRLAFARSTDAGRSWRRQPLEIRSPTDARDPCLALLRDGRVLLTFFDYDGERSTGVRVAVSSDLGRTFGEPIVLPQPWTDYTAVSAPVVEDSDGTLVLPVYGAEPGGSVDAALLGSDDGGASWQLRSLILAGSVVDDDLSEPWIVRDAETLVCFLRSYSCLVRRCESTDGGTTWSAPEVVFTCHSRVSAAQLSSGRWVAVHRSVVNHRQVVRWGESGGRRWSREEPLHGAGLGTYAGITETADGAVVGLYGCESHDRSRGDLFVRELTPPTS